MIIPNSQTRHAFGDHSLRSRLLALLLSLAVVLLILLALLDMGMLGPGLKNGGERLVSVNISSSQSSASKASTSKHNLPAKAAAASRQPLSEPPPPLLSQTPQPTFIHLSHADFVASDISRLPQHDKDGTDSEASQGGASQYGPGEGPGGAHLYNAQWYREPTHAEMSTYLPSGGAPGSWATIACRTIEHFHVEDCQELDESPAGTGLARALRRASWQFLVRPPRIGGKVLIGSWVRIRFDFTKSERQETAPAGLAD